MTKEELKVLKDWMPELELMARYNDNSIDYQRYSALDLAIKSLEQQPKTGKWEYVQYDYNPDLGNWHCSECRTIIPHMPEETDNTPIYKWCPMCGAKMEG